MSYIQFKRHITTHISLSTIPVILTTWLHTTIQLLLLYTIVTLLWGLALLRVWKYRPPSEENRGMIRNFQMTVTFGFSAVLSLYGIEGSILAFQTFVPAIDWVLFSLVILSFAGMSVMIWQQYHLQKAERLTLH